MKQVIAITVLMGIFCSIQASADASNQQAKKYQSKVQMIEQESAQIEDSIIHHDRYLAQNNADNHGLQIKIMKTKKSVQ